MFSTAVGNCIKVLLPRLLEVGRGGLDASIGDVRHSLVAPSPTLRTHPRVARDPSYRYDRHVTRLRGNPAQHVSLEAEPR